MTDIHNILRRIVETTAPSESTVPYLVHDDILFSMEQTARASFGIELMDPVANLALVLMES